MSTSNCMCRPYIDTNNTQGMLLGRFKNRRGGSRGGGGGAHPARAPPPKIGKNMIFWRKIAIFHTKYPKNFRAFLRNWEKYDFLV